MKLNEDTIAKYVILTGTVLIIAVFSNIVGAIGTSLDYLTGSTNIMSAFDG